MPEGSQSGGGLGQEWREGGIALDPPYAPDDPFGHAAYEAAREAGPLFSDETAYAVALAEWEANDPMPSTDERFAARADLYKGGGRCPVCGGPDPRRVLLRSDGRTALGLRRVLGPRA